MSHFLNLLRWFKSYGQKTNESIFKNVKKRRKMRVSISSRKKETRLSCWRGSLGLLHGLESCHFCCIICACIFDAHSCSLRNCLARHFFQHTQTFSSSKIHTNSFRNSWWGLMKIFKSFFTLCFDDSHGSSLNYTKRCKEIDKWINKT